MPTKSVRYRDFRMFRLSQADRAVVLQCTAFGLDGGVARSALEGGDGAANLIVAIVNEYFAVQKVGDVCLTVAKDPDDASMYVFTAAPKK